MFVFIIVNCYPVRIC